MKKVTKTVSVLIILFTLFISTPFTVVHADIFSSNNTNSQIASSSTIKEFDTIEDAAIYLKKKMVKREDTIVFKINKSYYKSLAKDIFLKAVEDNKNTSSSEGDYLLANWNGYSASVKYGLNYSKITYNMKYLTTYNEEKEVDKQVKKVLDNLNVYNKSDYTKIKAVHDYVVKNIHYDYTYTNHSSYNAIVNKKCVCQGYASITYKMLKELNVGVRYIVGTANDKLHAWNIVKVNSNWYNIDNTWDENLSSSNEISYKYFLKGSSDFYYHSRKDEYNSASFKNNFPTANVSYKKTFSKFKINNVTTKSTYISGYGEKNATLKAYVNNHQIGKTTRSSSKTGYYKIIIPKQKKGRKITVKMSKSTYHTTSKYIIVK